MPRKTFYDRLTAYYQKVGEVLRGEAQAASIFPNSTDIGTSRERIYATFLRQHVPSRCNVLFGGFLFSQDGEESRQLDIIITNESSLRFDFHNADGLGKSFACVDGCVAVASVKSTLTSAECEDALANLASIPPKLPLGNRANPLIKNPTNYNDWPFKIIFASDGVAAETIMDTMAKYFRANPQLPKHLRPDLIHVAGKYIIQPLSLTDGLHATATPAERELGYVFHAGPAVDVLGLSWATQNIQFISVSSGHILTHYGEMISHLEEPLEALTSNSSTRKGHKS